MELGTVGAVLRFAIELEGHSAEFYEEAASLAKDLPTREAFSSLAEAKRKRKKLVERSRREFVNEMLLEPIVGLEGSDDLVSTELSSGMDPHAALQLAKELEENSQTLYLDAAMKIGHLPQMARVFKKMGQGNADHKLKLESLGDVK
jgi:ABC-type transporter Mla maintaining outer membrane lipid asymmetry ATPase subunit MlaF